MLEFLKALLAVKFYRTIFIILGLLIIYGIVSFIYDEFLDPRTRELKASWKASAKEKQRKEKEFNEWKRKRDEDIKKSVKGTPEERYEIAKEWHNQQRYSEAYSVFLSLVGKYDNAEMLARMDFREWYDSTKVSLESADRYVRRMDDYFGNIEEMYSLRSDFSKYTKDMKNIIDALVKDNKGKRVLVKDQDEYESWINEARSLNSYYVKKLEAIQAIIDQYEARKEAEDRRERMEEAMRELEELDYDSDSSSSGTYDSVDLGLLPDMMYFVNDPDTVYQHYAYMTGGMGQKVRVYMSLGGDRKVSISYARNGMQVGRDFYTDQGTITKYL